MKNTVVRLFSSRVVQLILGLTVGLICLYLAFKNIAWWEVQKTILQADPIYVYLALGITTANAVLKILRWQMQLKADNPRLSLRGVSASFLSAQMLNALAPVRLGELQRIYVVGGSGSTHGFVLGTIVTEKFLDLLAYAGLIGILVLWIPLPEWLGGPAAALIVITLLQAAFLFIFALKRGVFIEVAEWLSRRLSTSSRGYLLSNLRAGFDSLDIIRRPITALKLSLLTACIWSAALITNYWLLLALDIQAPLAASLLVLIAVQVGVSLPALPGKLGVFELSCILALDVFGVNRAFALSYGILLHAVVLIPVLIPGLLSFLYLQLSNTPLHPRPPGSGAL